MRNLIEVKYLLSDEPGLARDIRERLAAEVLRIAPEYKGRLKVTVHRGDLRVRITGKGDREAASLVLDLAERRLGL